MEIRREDAIFCCVALFSFWASSSGLLSPKGVNFEVQALANMTQLAFLCLEHLSYKVKYVRNFTDVDDKQEFEEYAEKAKTLPESTTNEIKLILYGLYKQANVGPVKANPFH